MAVDDPFVPSDPTQRPRPGAGRRGAHESTISPRPASTRPYEGEPLPPSARAFLGLGLNPLVQAASPILLLIGGLRSSTSSTDVSGLRRHALDEIRRFEENAQRAGVRNEIVLAARYALCAGLDESVLSTPWGAQSEWAQHPLLVALHREAWGGEKFFEMLDRISVDPARHIDLMELQYLILALGFTGRYQMLERGHEQLADLQQNLYRKIRAERAPAGDPAARARDALPAGPAYTVKGMPVTNDGATAYDGAIRKVLGMLGQVPAGAVVLYACNQDVAAHLGELSVTSRKSRGVAGCVLDGGCRDVAFILEAGFPVFTRFVTPEDSTWRWTLEATQVPVTIGRVHVEPGDWVVGDDDGVVVVRTRSRRTCSPKPRRKPQPRARSARPSATGSLRSRPTSASGRSERYSSTEAGAGFQAGNESLLEPSVSSSSCPSRSTVRMAPSCENAILVLVGRPGGLERIRARAGQTANAFLADREHEDVVQRATHVRRERDPRAVG